MLKSHLKPVLGIVGLSILCGYIDSKTSDKIAYFHLSPGFGRRADIVNVKEIDKVYPRDWKCRYEDHPILLISKTAYTLGIEKDLVKPLQITIESISGMDDPVIIIKSLNKTILGCQNNNMHEPIEILHTEDEETTIYKFSQEPISKGTYYLFVGSYHNSIDEYKITILEDD